MNRVYIASFFNTRDRLYPIRDRLQNLGYDVVSTWLDEPEMPGEGFDPGDSKWHEFAMKDLREIENCDILLLDTFDVSPRGGRECEHGFAVGVPGGPYIYRIGPCRSIFHHIVDRSFKTWEECLEFLKDLKGID